MNLLHMYVRPTYKEIIRIDLKTEQEFLAGRAARHNDIIRAAFHRWNVVDAEANDGFRIFQNDGHTKDIDSSFFFPFQVLALKELASSYGDLTKAKLIAEGIDRGKLAISLEVIGAHQEASRQWQLAKTLTNRKSMKDVRSLIIKILAQEDTSLWISAERAVLGNEN